MILTGKYNTLRVVRLVDFGAYLDGEQLGEILMPKRYAERVEVGDEVEAFVYYDSEDRLVATTEKALASEGEFAFLRVTAVNKVGAFMDWGLAKDLLVPYNQQRSRMQVDESYIVRICRDEKSKRLFATEYYNEYLNNILPQYKSGEEVEILVTERTNLGYKAIINNLHTGIIYGNETYRNLPIGTRRKAYVRKVREDDKIDLSLEPQGYDKVEGLEAVVIDRLRQNAGFMAVGDKSDPELIRAAFGCSKKAFKMTIGALYKAGKIDIVPEGIRLGQVKNEK